jgi:uncharacterized protein (TIGR00369 family)
MREIVTDRLELARSVLDSQPFSRLLGAQVIAATDRSVELALDLTPDLQQQHAMAHGGVLAYLADNALTFAGGLALGEQVVTAQMNIHYLRPARGQRLIARAKVVSSSRSSALSQCDVFCADEGEENAVAFATGLIRSRRRAGAQPDG